jgi:hypothetical protein
MRKLTKEDQEKLKELAQEAVKAGWPAGKTQTDKDTYQIQMGRSQEITAKDVEMLLEIFGNQEEE